MNDVSNVPSAFCWQALQDKANSILIDVRSPEEWQESGVADLDKVNKEVKLLSWMYFTPSMHINKEFVSQLKKLVADENNAELYFICKTGGRSMQAADAAFKNGYKKCFNVQDGFLGNSFDDDFNPLDGWVKNGLPRRAL